MMPSEQRDDQDNKSNPDFNFLTMAKRQTLPSSLYRAIPFAGLLVGGLIGACLNFGLAGDCVFGCALGFIAYQAIANKRYK